MGDGPQAQIRTFAMPGEERVFFRYLHAIGAAVYAAVVALILKGGGTSAIVGLLEGAFFVGPFYGLVLFYRGRFVDRVVLDFSARRVVFHFPDDRGRIEKNFDQISHVKFQSYLTFVTDDGRVMVKRPPDKKGTLRILRSAFRVNQGGLVG